jgi:hypothetical protein
MAKNSLAKKLRELAFKGQYGWSRSPKNFLMGDPDQVMTYGSFKGRVDPNAHFCQYYWSLARTEMTFEEYKRVARLSCRYRRLVEYVTEVLPQWQTVREVHCGDNSVEVIQQSIDGRTRQVMVRAPSGDVCF